MPSSSTARTLPAASASRRRSATRSSRAGADAITLGNHAWDQREALVFIERQPRLVRPANYPPGTPGRGADLIETRARATASWSSTCMGRIFMDALDDPFAAVDREIAPARLGAGRRRRRGRHPCRGDEREAGARLPSRRPGRASSSAPTPTCRPPTTAILAGGTAYISDAGMCGDYDSVLGMQKDEPIRRFLQKTPGSRLEAGLGRGRPVRASPSRPTTGPASPRRVAAVPARAAPRGGLAALLGLSLRRPVAAVPMLSDAMSETMAPRARSAGVRERDRARQAGGSPSRRASTSAPRRCCAPSSTTPPGESISIRDIVEAFGERAFGFVLILFSLPNCVPMPPGRRRRRRLARCCSSGCR